jgi:hypothetical protein
MTALLCFRDNLTNRGCKRKRINTEKRNKILNKKKILRVRK